MLCFSPVLEEMGTWQKKMIDSVKDLGSKLAWFPVLFVFPAFYGMGGPPLIKLISFLFFCHQLKKLGLAAWLLAVTLSSDCYFTPTVQEEPGGANGQMKKGALSLPCQIYQKNNLHIIKYLALALCKCHTYCSAH